MNHSDQLDQLFTALAKAQGEMSAAAKDCANPFFKSRYADLGSIWAACREPLSKNGLSVLQVVQTTESGDVLHTTLGHSSGQYMTSTMPIRIKMEGKGGNELQALGAAITYLRRFSLAALVGVAPDDDNDGNGSNYKAAQATPKSPFVIIDVPLISENQALALDNLFALCNSDYQKNMKSWLNGKNISNIKNLPMTLYEGFKKSVDAHLAEMADKKTMVGE